MSDSVRSHGRQPTRLSCPSDSPGKNTGMGCHFLLQRMKMKSESEVAQSCPISSDPMDCSLPGSSVHGIFQARVLEWGTIVLSSRHRQEQWRVWVGKKRFKSRNFSYVYVCRYPFHGNFINCMLKELRDCQRKRQNFKIVYMLKRILKYSSKCTLTFSFLKFCFRWLSW